MNKRGQFFLVAAFVIISALIGITGVANYAFTQETDEHFNDLVEEVGFESKKVMDRAAYDEQDLSVATQEFLPVYGRYIRDDQVIFVYGTEGNIEGFYFDEQKIGSVGLNTGSSPQLVTVNQITGRQAEIRIEGKNARVNIDGKEYLFTLKDGYNLFYVIVKEEGNERLVAYG